ncbi:MAG TPA: CHAT domain-containing tetratricopeptide repeat protein [Thermoanaerobaculia bacterium]|nr:CHAT domain-containing tetratricopeptide repeat protein [Thermoanaerobaculia bacterium]
MNEPVQLELGHPIVRDLAAGESHSYLVRLEPGQYVRLGADQRGVDVVLSLFAPDGGLVAKMDSPSGTRGAERVSEVAKAAGDYRVEVKSEEASAKPGRYEMRIEDLRPATDQDRTRVQAERVYGQGEELRRKQKNWARAAASYQQALAIWRSLPDRGEEGLALYRIGTMRENLGDAGQGLELYDESIAAYQVAGDPGGEATVLNRRGGILNAQQKTDEALASFQRALELFRKLEDPHGQASSLNNIGAVHTALDRTRLAVEAYEEALGLWRKLGDTQNEGRTLLNLGGLYVPQGKLQEARDTLEASRKIAEQSADAELLCTALSHLGELDLRQERFAEGRTNLEKALALQRQAGDEQGAAVTLSSLGIAGLKAGDLDGSWKTEEEALALFRKLGDTAGEGIAVSNLGRIHYARDQDKEAVVRQREARALFEKAGDREGMALSRFGAARSLARLGDLEGARQELEPALDLVEHMRGDAPSLGFRASYLATKQHYWDLYVDILMRSREEALALQASERRRARSLLDALAETGAAAEGGTDPGLTSEIRDAEQRLRTAETRRSTMMAGGGGGDPLAAIEVKIRGLLTRLDVLRTRMRGGNPRLAELAPPAPLTIGEIQKRLVDVDTLLLVYSLGEERSYLWTVSPRKIESYTLPGRQQIEDAARQLLDLLPRASREAQVSEPRAAKALSALVLAPAAERIAGFRRLLIVGDGTLQLVPFGALPVPGPPESAAGGERLLVESHELVSLPSASVLAMLRRREEGRTRKPLEDLRIAIIADPVFRADDPRVQGNGVPSPPSPLPLELRRSAGDLGIDPIERLPYSRQEADAILGMIKQGRPLKAFDFDATPELLTGGSLHGYHIIHIATHSLLDSREPELSGIVFSMVDSKGAPRDGFLRLHEIYNLGLDAGLVVLSACETGAGKEVRGEGLLGITRGFMYAGVPQLVVSLWKVEDRSTAELMKRFYHQLLEKGHPPAEALRQAQLSMLAEPAWSAPRNWAGFIFQGDFAGKREGGVEAQDSGGVILVKKAGSDLPPPKVAPDRPRKKPAPVRPPS